MRSRLMLALLVISLLLGISSAAATETGGAVYKLEWLKTWYEGTGTYTVPATLTPDSLDIHAVKDNNQLRNYLVGNRLQLTFSFSGEQEVQVPANTVEIRLPASIFTDAFGNPAEQTVFVPLPLDTSFNYRIDAQTNEIVIYNFEPINEALVFTTQIDYIVRPSNVKLPSAPGETIQPFTNQITGEVTITRPNTQPVVDNTNTLDLSISTDSKLSYVSKSVSSTNYYPTWPTTWGPAPNDNDDLYFYVGWTFSHAMPNTNTQSFNLSIADTLNPADGGEVHSWILPGKTRTIANLQDGWANNLDEFNAAAQNAYTVQTPSTYGTNINSYLYVRYPRSKLALNPVTNAMEYRVTNAVTDNLVGAYGAQDQKSGSGTFLYREMAWNPSLAGGANKSARGPSPGMIDRLERAWEAGQTGQLLALHPGISQTWTVSSYQQDWERTMDAEGNFGVMEWTAYHQDSQFSLDTSTPTSTSYYPLLAGDYALKRLILNRPSESIYGEPTPLGTNTLIAQDLAKYGTTTVQVTTVPNPTSESDWITIGVAEINRTTGTSFTYTPVNGTPVTAPYSIPIDLTQVGVTGDVLGVRLVQTSKAARVNQSYGLEMQLYPSDHLITGLKEYKAGQRVDPIRPSVNLFNLSKSWASGGNAEADGKVAQSAASINMNRAAFYAGNSKSTLSQLVDYDAKVVRLNFQLHAYNYTPFPTGTTLADAVETDLLQEQKQGVFYDLLPPGTYVDPATIRAYQYRYSSPSSTYPAEVSSVEYIDNFRDTGRTLMILRVTTPDPEVASNFYTRSASGQVYLYTGFTVRFTAINTFDNMIDNPKSGRNYSAYESVVGPLGTGGRVDMPPAYGFADPAAQTAFTNVNGVAEPDETRFLHAFSDWGVDPALSTELGFDKLVKTPRDPGFVKKTEAQAGGMYTYRLRLANRPETSSRNIILYDSMEDRVPADAPEYWQGVLEGIDLTQPQRNYGLEPKVYYATRYVEPKNIVGDRLVVDGQLNTALWQELDVTQPPYPADLKAIAVDMRFMPDGTPFILPPERSLVVLMQMRAPGDATPYVDPTDYAWNSAYLSAQTERAGILSANAVVDVTPTQVSIRPVDLTVNKVSSPATGTPEQPTLVGEGATITYTVSVRNTNIAEVIPNVVLEDVIPAGLTIDPLRTTYRFGYAGFMPVSAPTNTRVTQTQDGQKLTFTIDQLAAGEQVDFRIITVVNKPTTEGMVRHENTAVVTQAFGHHQDIQSPTTYHATDSVTWQVPFRKLLDAGGRVPKAGEFQVVVTDTTDARNVVAGPFSNSGTAPYAFDIPLRLAKTGWHNYYLREVVPPAEAQEANMTYSGVQFLLRAYVWRGTDGKLAITSSSVSLNGVLQSDPKIINTYRASGTYIPTIRKRLFVRAADGVTLTDYPFASDQYRVTLLDDFGRVQEAANVDGVFTFPTRYATQADIGRTFVFWFTEQLGNQDSVVYDGRKIRMEVTVVDEGGGVLSYEEKFFHEDDAVLTDDEPITGQFENEYVATSKTLTKKWTLPNAPGYDALPNPLPNIVVQLFRDGAEFGDPVVMTADNADPEASTLPTYAEWTYTWENLPKRMPGTTEDSVYTVKELAPPPQFQLTQDGDVLTNKFQKGTFTARKLWSGVPEGYAGLPEVTFKLYRTILNDPQPALARYEYMAGRDALLDGVVNATALDPGEINPWEYQWGGLPASGTMHFTDVNGQTGTLANVSFEYEVREAAFTATAANADDFFIDTKASASTFVTNVYTKTTFTASKVWENGPPVPRPEVLLQLLQNGAAYSAAGVTNPVAINTPADQGSAPISYTWEDLPIYSDISAGTKYVYSFVEVQENPDSPGNYLPIASPSTNFPYQPRYTEDGTTVINAYVQPTRQVVAHKVWVNGPDTDHQSVELRLTRIPENIANDPTAVPETVLAEPVQSGIAPKYTYTWSDLAATTLLGVPYVYHVEEVTNVGGIVTMGENLYTLETAVDEALGEITLTNTYRVPTGDVRAVKSWHGGPAEDHTTAALRLYRQSGVMDVPEPVTQEYTAVPQAGGGILYTWKQLELTDSLGNRYTFHVVEDGVNEAGQVVVNGNTYQVGGTALHVTNTYVQPLITVTATKTWINGPVEDHTPVELLLYRHTVVDGVPTAPEQLHAPVNPDEPDAPPAPLAPDAVTGDAPGPYTYIWQNLPGTDTQGVPYVYTILEAGEEDGFITVGLPAAEEPPVEEPPTEEPPQEEPPAEEPVNGVTQTEEPAPEEPVLEEPAIEEPVPAPEPRRYQVLVGEPQVGDAGVTIAVTNTYTPPMGPITAVKRWVGGNRNDYSAVALDLYRQVAGGEQELVEDAVYTAEPGAPWEFFYTFTDQPLSDNTGLPYTYTVQEQDAVNGSVMVGENEYAVNAIGREVFNTYVPPMGDITAEKTWIGGDTADHTQVNLLLYRMAQGMLEPALVNAVPQMTGDGPFNYTWENLPLYSMTAQPYTYSVVEEGAQTGQVSVNGNVYAVTTEGADPICVTNTYLPPDPFTFVPNARKVLEGGTLAAGQFTFLFTDHEGTRHTVTHDADGVLNLPEVSLHEEGSYTFTLKEVPGTAERMTYDTAEYVLNLTLEKSADNTLTPAAGGWLKDGAAYAAEELLFTNVLAAPEEPPVPPDPPAPTYPTLEVPLTAKKVLKNGTLKAGEFTFVLKDNRGTVLAEVSNLQDGTVVFPNRTFSRAVKDYTYTVEEKAGADPKTTYDRTVYTIQVTTTPRNGLLEAQVEVLKDGTPYAGPVVFTNQRLLPPTGDSMPTYILLMLLTAAGLGGAALVLRAGGCRRRQN